MTCKFETPIAKPSSRSQTHINETAKSNQRLLKHDHRINKQHNASNPFTFSLRPFSSSDKSKPNTTCSSCISHSWKAETDATNFS